MYPPTWHQLAAGLLFLGVYAAIATDRVDKAKAALLGAALMLLLGIIPQQDAFGSGAHTVERLGEFAAEYEEHERDAGRDGSLAYGAEHPRPAEVQAAADTLEHAGLRDIAGVDWNTIFLLIGMMVYVGITAKTGVFRWIAIKSARLARGEPIVILIALSVVTALLSAALDNVTTVLLMAPVTLLICDALDVSPVPMLMAEVVASNIGGTATLIGDPPNILIGSQAGYSFADFVGHLGPIALLSLAAFVAYAWLLWRKQLRASAERRAEVMAFDASKAIQDRRLLARCLAVGALILVGFGVHGAFGWEAATVALSGAALLLVLSGLEFNEALEAVEWGTIFFFVGLFIMVGGLAKVGLIDLVSRAVLNQFGHNTFLLAIVVLWVSAFASAVVDNIPYVAAMCPLVTSLAEAVTGQPGPLAAQDPRIMPIWWGLALGACLGGNGTLVGASANVVVAGIAGRSGHKIGFVQFTRVGLPVMLLTVALSTVYLWLRYMR